MIDQIGPNYIGFQTSQLGNSFSTLNPKELKDNPYTLYTATQYEIHSAAELAEKAFYEYAELSGSRRATFLEAIAIEMEAIKEDIVKVYCSESGLPEGRANGEFGRTCFQLKSYANHIRKEEHLNWKTETAASRYRAYTRCQPIVPIRDQKDAISYQVRYPLQRHQRLAVKSRGPSLNH